MSPSFTQKYLRRHYALPGEHGSWVFILSPLLIGLCASGAWSIASAYLVIAAIAAFLLRQPLTIAVKVYSRRRPRQDLSPAWFWMCVYGLIGLLAVGGLISRGFTYLVILAIPGIPVFIWHLYLVSKRAERRQAGVEVVASGVLALTAPAAYWVGVGKPDPIGWWLFGLVWLQSAASIVYAYLRLEQRELKAWPDLHTRFQMARRALAYTSFNLIAVGSLSLTGVLPPLLPLPYLLQWGEAVWGSFRPAVGVKPTRIGVRQLIVSSLFTLLFILAWR